MSKVAGFSQMGSSRDLCLQQGIQLLLRVKDVEVMNVPMALVCRVVCVCGLWSHWSHWKEVPPMEGSQGAGEGLAWRHSVLRVRWLALLCPLPSLIGSEYLGQLP